MLTKIYSCWKYELLTQSKPITIMEIVHKIRFYPWDRDREGWKKPEDIKSSFLPPLSTGQAGRTQTCSCSLGPLHWPGKPSQRLIRSLTPSPHVVEQGDHWLHGPQPSSVSQGASSIAAVVWLLKYKGVNCGLTSEAGLTPQATSALQSSVSEHSLPSWEQ